MTTLFHLAAVFFLITLHTAIRLSFPGLDSCFDLLLVYVGYLGAFRRPKEGIPIVILAGLSMDSLSGGVFGLFLTTYIWFFVLMNGIVRFLHRGNRLLMLFATLIGVVIENMVHLGTASLLREGFPVLQVLVDRTVAQLGWAVVIGPVLLLLTYRLHRLWEEWLNTVMVRDV